MARPKLKEIDDEEIDEDEDELEIEEEVDDEVKPSQKETIGTGAKVVEVTTQTQPAIQLIDGKIVDLLELNVLIYNKLCKIEREVA